MEENKKLEVLLSDLKTKGINKVSDLLEGLSKDPIRNEEIMSLYNGIYSIATAGNTALTSKLYLKFQEYLHDYLNHTSLPCLRVKHGEFLLKEFVTRWSHYNVVHGWLLVCYRYLKRYYVARERITNLTDIGIKCFVDTVYKEMSVNLMDAVVSLIDKERDDAKIDRALVKRVVDVFVELDVYEKGFEERVVRDTGDYYLRKASSWIMECSCPEFMVKVEECLRKEEDLVRSCMLPDTAQKLVSEAESKLLVLHSTQLLEKEDSGLNALLAGGKLDDLARMYRLYSRVSGGLLPVYLVFKNHVEKEGEALVRQTEEELIERAMKKDAMGLQEKQVLLVKGFIELHDRYVSYVSDFFQSNTMFFQAIKEAFESFCNKKTAEISAGELLSVFIDYTMKQKNRDDDKPIEDTLEKVVRLLAYVHGKDLFAEFHRKKLARRLLLNKSDSYELERYLLTKLKQQYGGQFTSKIEGMVRDLTICKDTRENFAEYLVANPDMNPGIDLAVTVLTIGLWPSYKTFNANFPPEMLRCVQVFERFYQRRTRNTRLSWVYSLGTCTLIGKFEPKTMDLIVTTLQASALLLFNSSKRWNYSEIKVQLDLSDQDVTRVLHSLSCGKYKILVKEPDTKHISETDYFEFNPMFTDRMKRIKVALPPVDDHPKNVVETVLIDRRHSIDATIVRIMKSRKVLSHQTLMSECIEVLSHMFKPDIKIIKLQIEILISRNYLERDSNDPNVYRYLA